MAVEYPLRCLSCFRLYFWILIFVSLLSTGCGTLRNGRGWGEDAVYPVELGRIPRAAYRAFLDWQTLIPAAGALLFRIDHFDRKVSDWANTRHPFFGSQKTSTDISDYFYDALLFEALLTTLATPSGDDPQKWAYSKLKGIAVEAAALGITDGITTSLKRTVRRTRPDGSDRDSFPSSHSSGAFSASTLSNRNLDSIPLPDQVKIPVQIGNVVLATGVALGRIEGKSHFPSDVLAGAALGRFIAVFIHDAFLGLPEGNSFGLSIIPQKGGGLIQLSFSY
jgi:membrane-associated phospholipid phosphatase